MKYLLIITFIISLLTSGCTIVNLAPPATDDGLLQQTLTRYNGTTLKDLKDLSHKD